MRLKIGTLNLFHRPHNRRVKGLTLLRAQEQKKTKKMKDMSNCPKLNNLSNNKLNQKRKSQDQKAETKSRESRGAVLKKELPRISLLLEDTINSMEFTKSPLLINSKVTSSKENLQFLCKEENLLNRNQLDYLLGKNNEILIFLKIYIF